MDSCANQSQDWILKGVSMDELSPATELATEYARQLESKQPNHELLRYLTEGENPELDQEFEDRFWNKPFSMEGQPGHLVNATIWANYAVALKNATEGQQYLADFLAGEMKGYVTLNGKPINASTSQFAAEGEEEFGLNYDFLLEDLIRGIAGFYHGQWFKTTVNNHAVQVRLNTHIIKYVVITETNYGAMISVKRVS